MKLPLSLTGAACAAALLTSSTLEAAPEPAGADRFPVTVEALDARRAEIFSRVDANGDGLISSEEFSAHKPLRRGGGADGKHPRSHPPSHPSSKGHRPRPTDEQLAAMEDRLFEQLDANADGLLSRSEFSTSAMRSARKNGMRDGLFAHADSNDDGFLTPDEFPPGSAADMDLDGDGEITRDELRAARQREAG